MARPYGLGRVMVAGHDGILDSNGGLMINAARWLDVLNRRAMLISAPRGGVGAVSVDTGNLIARAGFSVTFVSALTADVLASASVLVVNNSWGAFTDTEIENVRSFVSVGGGLWMAGEQWSWDGYNTGVYPMARLSQPYEMIWDGNYLNSADGGSVFTELYPNI